MNRSQTRFVFAVAALFGVAWAAPVVRAATINVPTDQPTIQDAVDNAADGDTILVDDGTYTENIIVDVDNLTIISVNGVATTFVESNTADTPIFDVQAKGLTLGAAGQGFTITQQAAGPGTAYQNSAVMIEGDKVAGSTTTIAENTINGTDSDAGIAVSPLPLGYADSGATLNITNNALGMDTAAVTYGFNLAIAFDAPANSATRATIAIDGDTIDDFNSYAVYLDGNIFESSFSVTHCSFTAVSGGGTGGIYSDAGATNSSSVTISDTTIDNVDLGVYLSDGVNVNSSMDVSDLTVTNFGTTGIYVDALTEASTLSIDPTVLSGDPLTGVYGVFVGAVVDVSSFSMTDSSIDGVQGGGVFIPGNISLADVTIHNNTIDMVDAGAGGIGIFTLSVITSNTTITNNTVTGFDDIGIYDPSPEYSTTMLIDGNTLTGSPGGALEGIDVGTVLYNSSVTVTNNTVENISGATSNCLAIDALVGRSNAIVNGNTLSGRPGSGANVGILGGPVVSDSTLQVDSNTLSEFFNTGIEVTTATFLGSVSLTHNTLTASSDGATEGLNLGVLTEGAEATVSDNVVTGFGNVSASVGLYVDELGEGAKLTVTNNTFTANVAGADAGMIVDSGPTDGVDLAIDHNTFTGFLSYGVGMEFGGEGGAVTTITNNTMTAAQGGGENGIYFDGGIAAGVQCDIKNNTVDGYTVAGVDYFEITTGCIVTITNNTVTSINSGSGSQYGFFGPATLDTGSSLNLSNNIVNNIVDPEPGNSSEGGLGFLVAGPTAGSSLTMNNNVANGDGSGPDTAGFVVTIAPSNGSTLEMNDNQVNGMGDTGLYVFGPMATGGTLNVRHNHFEADHYGIFVESNVDLTGNSHANFDANDCSKFDTEGISFGGSVSTGGVSITNNRLNGNAADTAINFADVFNNTAVVDVHNNCFTGVDTGVIVTDVDDNLTQANINYNDFDGVAVTGIINNDPDLDISVDASHSFFGSVPTPFTGDVYHAFELASPPDGDGDGVSDCDDQCPDTAAGDAVNGSGCSCLQLDPTTDTDGDGTVDCLDACPTDPNKIAAGQCGCGNVETDTDGDGIADCVDNCPLRANADQADFDGDGIGDVCDAIPFCGLGLYIPFPIMLTGIVLAKAGIRRKRRS